MLTCRTSSSSPPRLTVTSSSSMVLSSALSETSSRKFLLLLQEWALMYRYQEMIAHIPIASHPDPKTILVVGGGDGGVIREALKHKSVEKVTLVDIDEVS